jgi:hypothetical protein
LGGRNVEHTGIGSGVAACCVDLSGVRVAQRCRWRVLVLDHQRHRIHDSASERVKMKDLAKENRRLRKALGDVTAAYVKIIDLFLECSMENVGLKPAKK